MVPFYLYIHTSNDVLEGLNNTKSGQGKHFLFYYTFLYEGYHRFWQAYKIKFDDNDSRTRKNAIFVNVFPYIHVFLLKDGSLQPSFTFPQLSNMSFYYLHVQSCLMFMLFVGPIFKPRPFLFRALV